MIDNPNDWRMWLNVTPKLRTHLRYGTKGKVIGVESGKQLCPHGILTIRMECGDVIKDAADNWVTA